MGRLNHSLTGAIHAPAIICRLVFQEITATGRDRSTWLIIAICALLDRAARKKLATWENGPKPGPLIRQESPSASMRQPARISPRPGPAQHSPGRSSASARQTFATPSKELKQGGAHRSLHRRSSPKTRSRCREMPTFRLSAGICRLQIQQADGPLPRQQRSLSQGLEEFMTEIIKANNIALPQLPPYQKYGYDEKEHKLIILEYADLKNDRHSAQRCSITRLVYVRVGTPQGYLRRLRIPAATRWTKSLGPGKADSVVVAKLRSVCRR